MNPPAPLRAALVAEAVGTFALVLAGTGAIVVNDITGGVVSHAGIAMTFGLVVMTMIFAFGDVSGAHINPAVTSAFCLLGRMSPRRGLLYAIAQVVGALAASAVMAALFPGHPTLGATIPAGTDWQSFILEVVLTFLLVLVVLAMASGAKERGVMAALAIGGVVGFEAMFAGPISGASMNPARSLAPALISAEFASLWLYVVAPFVGAAMACLVSRQVFAPVHRAAEP